MVIEKIPFKIDFPLRILKNKKIDFDNKKERERIFKRHIYYYKYGRIKNPFFKKRNKIFLNLAKEVIKFLKKKYSYIDILNVSSFGSSLYSKNNEDFDFLVITKGNIFSYEEIELIMLEKKRKIKYQIGISIKGIENFQKGYFDPRSKVSLNLQSQIIYRTAISLFRRHIPIIGFDFVDNKKTFLKNSYAQVSDLLSNAYELYYLKDKRPNINNKERSRKILSRIYEAVSYMDFLTKDKKINNFKKRIFISIENGTTFYKSKKIFDEVLLFYNKKIKYLNKKFKSRRKILKILSNGKFKKNIKERLENYWKCVGLPYKWIEQILDILSEYNYNEDLAIKKVRDKFPSFLNKRKLDYIKKLQDFRKIKVKNIAKRIKNHVYGTIVADVGGRADDFIENIILLDKKIKKAYVTDLCSFTTRSKNKKINFVVQSSLTKIPFTENNIDTIILSMVLHHLKKKQQKEMINHLVSYLNNNGRVILIEDTFPIKTDLNRYDRNTRDFLKFNIRDKKRILSFYDWFGNRLMRNRNNIPLFYNYETMEEWKNIFKKNRMKQIHAEFIKENKSKPDIFPPKAILVFQKS